jgi:hypothetical protein
VGGQARAAGIHRSYHAERESNRAAAAKAEATKRLEFEKNYDDARDDDRYYRYSWVYYTGLPVDFADRLYLGARTGSSCK